MPQNLERLASRLLCPRCQGVNWVVSQGPEAPRTGLVGLRDRVAQRLGFEQSSEGLTCGSCGASYPCEDGVLVLTKGRDDPEIVRERDAARATERDPALGGINDSFDNLANAEGPLRDAVLALPWGDRSRYYEEPGYFSNVRSSAAAFTFIVRNLRVTAGERLLDLGADLTWSTSQFARRGLACTAVDINHHLRTARLFEQSYGISYNLVRADMTTASFGPSAFDVVVGFNALHHSSNLHALANNIARVLAPGGRVGLVEPYCETEADKEAFGRDQVGAGISEHVYLLEEWHRAFAEAGLAVRTHRIADSFAAVYEKPKDAVLPAGVRASLAGLLSGFYDARLTVLLNPPSRARPGELLCVPVRVENRGPHTWCPNARFPVRLSYHLYAEHGPSASAAPAADAQRPLELVSWDNPRADFATDMSPGDATTLMLQVTAPRTSGVYVAEVDLVHEFVTWFAEKGLAATRLLFAVV